MSSRMNYSTARIIVHTRTGETLEQVKASVAVFRAGTIRRRTITLKPSVQAFRLRMPVGEHTLFVSAAGYYEATRRVKFVRNADPVERIILESQHRPMFRPFAALAPAQQEIFRRSARRQGVSAASQVYERLPPLKKAAALNILAKMDAIPVPYPGSPTILSHVDHIDDFFADRVYLTLKRGASSLDRINDLVKEGNTRFVPAPAALHKEFRAASFKTEETSGRGNLQISFNDDDPRRLKIDADIDIYADVLKHLFGEVFRNHLTGLKTDPYRVYGILTESGIQPEYHLVDRDDAAA